MTNRDFYTTIINANINDEVTAFAKNALTKMDERNAKRAATPSKAQVENEPIKAAILEKMERPMLAAEIAELVGISTNKASALCRQLVESGKMTSEEVKVPKKGKQKQYTKVA